MSELSQALNKALFEYRASIANLEKQAQAIQMEKDVEFESFLIKCDKIHQEHGMYDFWQHKRQNNSIWKGDER